MIVYSESLQGGAGIASQPTPLTSLNLLNVDRIFVRPAGGVTCFRPLNHAPRSLMISSRSRLLRLKRDDPAPPSTIPRKINRCVHGLIKERPLRQHHSTVAMPGVVRRPQFISSGKRPIFNERHATRTGNGRSSSALIRRLVTIFTRV